MLAALLSALRMLVELAGFFLLGQGALFVLAGGRREQNPVYRLFHFLTRPVVTLVRWLTPRWLQDRHVPLLAFMLLFWVWIGLALARRSLCAPAALACQGALW